MEYRGENVRAALTGRINSYDDTIPDCICSILLTDMHIFVSEDNYDGTYTDHCIFSLSSVTDVLMDQPYATSEAREMRNDFGVFNGLLGGVLGVFGKPLLAKNKEEANDLTSRSSEKYFTIVSMNDLGNNEKTYFTLTSDGEDKFIKEFKKMRN